MENIRQALDRARGLNVGTQPATGTPSFPPATGTPPYPPPPAMAPAPTADHRVEVRRTEITLNAAHLETNRIVAHDEADPRSKSFDMLRTQVLQSMERKNWHVLGVTSPTPACGKTVTSLNLAFSVARQHEQLPLVIDLDFQKPQVAGYLGLNSPSGMLAVLEGRMNLANAIVQTRIGNSRVKVLPAESPKPGSSAWMTSRAMSAVLQEIKRDYRSHIAIIDLPPMLSSDDVIAVLPQLDCLLLVAAVGKSTVAEIDECNKHLESADVVRLVLNKAPEAAAKYYKYY